MTERIHVQGCHGCPFRVQVWCQHPDADGLDVSHNGARYRALDVAPAACPLREHSVTIALNHIGEHDDQASEV